MFVFFVMASFGFGVPEVDVLLQKLYDGLSVWLFLCWGYCVSLCCASFVFTVLVDMMFLLLYHPFIPGILEI